jgi:hypothetical protein
MLYLSSLSLLSDPRRRSGDQSDSTGRCELGSKSPAPASAENEWRHSFGDPKLDSLMRRALDNNFNLCQTVTRFDQAKWLRMSENHLGVVIEHALDAVDRAIGKRTGRLARSA